MKTKTVKITLEGFGSYLGMEKGCFIVKDKQGNTNKYPLFENLIDEIRVKSGNFISSGVLASCGFWGIDCLFLTQKGKPVATLRSLDDDSHARAAFNFFVKPKTSLVSLFRLFLSQNPSIQLVFCKGTKRLSFCEKKVIAKDVQQIIK